MKISRLDFGCVKNYLTRGKLPHVEMNFSDYSGTARKQLYQAKDVFENYAKHNKIHISFNDVSKSDNISMQVEKYKTFNKPLAKKDIADLPYTHYFLADDTAAKYVYPHEQKLIGKLPIYSANGELKTYERIAKTEDNFLRHVYRTLEELTGKVLK